MEPFVLALAQALGRRSRCKDQAGLVLEPGLMFRLRDGGTLGDRHDVPDVAR
jgi:hypothetical protein